LNFLIPQVGWVQGGINEEKQEYYRLPILCTQKQPGCKIKESAALFKMATMKKVVK